jgi:GNAT superfamily N-acetyltransferase
MKKSEIKIRPLKYKELPIIAELYKVSMIPVFKKLKIKYDMDGIKKFAKDLFKEEKIFVLEKNGKIIACGSVGANKYSKDKANVGVLQVSENEQGHGYGRKMMEFLENYVRERGFKKLKLDVLNKNPAIKFYRHMGFKDYKLVLEKSI